jgi:predicted GIY-YIG superfamily endonuclease
MTWVVYILACNDGSFYVGHTQDVSARFQLHLAGKAAKHTATHPPDKILFQESFTTEQDAIRRELQLKRWSHAKKEALIAGNQDKLRRLSKSRD